MASSTQPAVGGGSTNSKDHHHSDGSDASSATKSSSLFGSTSPHKKALTQLLLFVFVDVLGFSIVLPLVPTFAKLFDATPSTIGCLMACNAFAQLCTAPIIGRLSDRYGRRPLLLFCVTGTIVSFVILARANSLSMIFFSRILDGVMGGNISLAHAYVSDITQKGEARTRGIGLVSMALGFGFVVGPALGGALTLVGYRFPALIAAFLSAVNLLGIYVYLPEPLDRQQRLESNSHHRRFPLMTVLKALQTPTVSPLLQSRLLYGIMFTMWETCFLMFTSTVLELDHHTACLYLGYVGVVFALVQGGLVVRLTRRYTYRSIMTTSFTVLSLAMFIWPMTRSTYPLLIVLLPLGLCSGILNTLINSTVSQLVNKYELGEMMGVTSAAGSLSRVIGPLLGGHFVHHYGFQSVGYICGAIGTLGVLVTLVQEVPSGGDGSQSKDKK
eukprot:TRINITY_DN2712_c1_g2_i2.p1 TRINITY_DN2712_c1_g2~~TRINITY_DN2712_c1_g2_i2.p1  ORF type:complete len:442 (+),score=62.47 TRINITY_DN2712_c1_g2_i2:154-1479(+)